MKPNDNTVSGKWEWFQTSRSFGLPPYTPQNTGKSWMLEFNANLTCTQSGDFLSSSGIQNSTGTGTYTLTDVRQVNNNLVHGVLTISLTNYKITYPNFFKRSQDTLILDYYSAVDGSAHFFIRK